MKNTATNDAVLKAAIAAQIDADKINVEAKLDYNEITGLLIKIVDSETIYHGISDKYTKITGETRFGEGTEEYFEDLVLPIAYDKEGTNTLVPHRPTFRKSYYTYALEPKNFPLTIDKVGLKSGFTNNAGLTSYAAQHVAKFRDSVVDYENYLKKGLLGFYAGLAVDSDSTATTFATGTAYEVGKVVKPTNESTERAVVFYAIPATNTSSYQELVSDGALVVREVVKEVAYPSDSTSGEDFCMEIKQAAKDFKFASNKYNLNGARQGDDGTYTLYVHKNITTKLDVKTLAGAFHENRLLAPVDIEEVDDFGEGNEDILAVMVDDRGLKLFLSENQTDENVNAEAHIINIFQLRKWMPRCSANTNIRVFKKAA